MKRILPFAITPVLLLAVAACDGDPVRPENKAPEVASLAIGLESVRAGDACPIICRASDPDGDALTYEWVVGAGYLIGSGNEITYVPLTCCLGGNPLYVIVRDGRGGETRADLLVPVRL